MAGCLRLDGRISFAGFGDLVGLLIAPPSLHSARMDLAASRISLVPHAPTRPTRA